MYIKKLRISLSVVLLALAFVASSQEPYVTELVSHSLEKMDVRSKTVVFAGQSYQFDFQPEKSSYVFKADTETALKLSELKLGEVYYFEKMASGNDMESNNFKKVIFISKSKPSE